jgi:hypothetical protein
MSNYVHVAASAKKQKLHKICEIKSKPLWGLVYKNLNQKSVQKNCPFFVLDELAAFPQPPVELRLAAM